MDLESVPILEFIPRSIAVFHVLFADLNDKKLQSKPNNIDFCEIRYSFESLPVEKCEFSHQVHYSNSIMHFAFDKRQKLIYGYARWVNRHGKVGRWSAQFTAIVP